MKKHIVTLLLGLLVAVVSGMLHRAVVKAAIPHMRPQVAAVIPLTAPSPNTLPTVGFGPGPMPCPPSCLKVPSN